MHPAQERKKPFLLDCAASAPKNEVSGLQKGIWLILHICVFAISSETTENGAVCVWVKLRKSNFEGNERNVLLQGYWCPGQTRALSQACCIPVDVAASLDCAGAGEGIYWCSNNNCKRAVCLWKLSSMKLGAQVEGGGEGKRITWVTHTLLCPACQANGV